jgi:cysteine synthase
MAKYLIEQAEQRGELVNKKRIVEVTSGNTGIAFSMIASIKGFEFIAVMPESMSAERVKMMKSFGAKVILTPAKEDVGGAVKKYKELIKKYNQTWLPKQFENKDNIEGHKKGIGKEIADQIPAVEVFVAGIGTGGTLLGVGKALKEKNPHVKIIGVEPAESAVLNNKKSGLHKIQGIGEGFIPELVKENINLIDEVIEIKSSDAIKMQKKIATKYGLLVGISSGANFIAAKKLKKKYNTVVTVFPDRGERYLS